MQKKLPLETPGATTRWISNYVYSFLSIIIREVAILKSFVHMYRCYTLRAKHICIFGPVWLTVSEKTEEIYTSPPVRHMLASKQQKMKQHTHVPDVIIYFRAINISSNSYPAFTLTKTAGVSNQDNQLKERPGKSLKHNKSDISIN